MIWPLCRRSRQGTCEHPTWRGWTWWGTWGSASAVRLPQWCNQGWARRSGNTRLSTSRTRPGRWKILRLASRLFRSGSAGPASSVRARSHASACPSHASGPLSRVRTALKGTLLLRPLFKHIACNTGNVCMTQYWGPFGFSPWQSSDGQSC